MKKNYTNLIQFLELQKTEMNNKASPNGETGRMLKLLLAQIHLGIVYSNIDRMI